MNINESIQMICGTDTPVQIQEERRKSRRKGEREGERRGEWIMSHSPCIPLVNHNNHFPYLHSDFIFHHGNGENEEK